MIRLWEQRDIIYLRNLIEDFLISQNKHGWGVAVSTENINWYLQIGYEQVRLGQPHLVYEKGGRIISYIQMGEAPHVLKFGEKTAEIFAFYTVPEERHQFVGVELFREAGIRSANLGFKRIYSTVFLENEVMLKLMFFNPAIWPKTVRLEWSLENDPQFENGKITKLTERVK